MEKRRRIDPDLGNEVGGWCSFERFSLHDAGSFPADNINGKALLFYIINRSMSREIEGEKRE